MRHPEFISPKVQRTPWESPLDRISGYKKERDSGNEFGMTNSLLE
jgi:hypothetical protein